MEKRALLAIALCFLVLLAWSYLFSPPPPAPRPAPAAGAEASRQAEGTPAASPAPPPAQVEKPQEPSPAVGAPGEEQVRLETDLVRLELTNRGARVSSWHLKAFTAADGEPVELVPAFGVRDHLLPLAIELEDPARTREVNEALFKVDRESSSPGPAGSRAESVRFVWSDGKGLQVEKSLTLRPGSYLADLRVGVVDQGRRLPVRIVWGPGFEAREPHGGSRQLHYTGQAVWDVGGGVARVARNRVKQDIVLPETGQLKWAGLEEQFFAALILPAGSRGGVVVHSDSIVPEAPPGEGAEAKEPKPEPQLRVAVSLPEGAAQLFVGPKKYTLLRGLGNGLDGVVWFSSYSLIYWLAKYLFLALLWIHDHLVPNYGLAIIVATVAIRLLFFPLNQYSMVNMRKMQAQMQKLQPRINAIKAKYKKSRDAEGRAKMNQEMMALYKKEGVNPMGGMSGCMPLLIQFPILIAFYNVLTVAFELRGAPFLGWIHDLTSKDPFYVTPLLMGATQFLQQKMTTTQGGDPMQQRMMLMMPVVFTVMFLNLPSGLVLYWFVNNLLGIGQQWLVNRHLGRTGAVAQKA